MVFIHVISIVLLIHRIEKQTDICYIKASNTVEKHFSDCTAAQEKLKTVLFFLFRNELSWYRNSLKIILMLLNLNSQTGRPKG